MSQLELPTQERTESGDQAAADDPAPHDTPLGYVVSRGLELPDFAEFDRHVWDATIASSVVTIEHVTAEVSE